MRKNTSPWLHQLPERTHHTLTADIETDVAVIGGGIAGVATAYHILHSTKKRVVILERYRLAHGATGHNAGQVVAQFERGLTNLVEKFGFEKAIAGQKAIEDAWDILDSMYYDAKLDIPYFKFMGYSGLTNKEQTILRLEHNRLRAKGGLPIERMYIREDAPFLSSIPRRYAGLFTIVPRIEITKFLETDREDFVAVHAYQKGVINSALFCERVIAFLIQHYADRFSLFEHTPVHKIILHEEHGVIDAEKHIVTAERVVLCTNGFEELHIIDKNGLEIDARYHYLVSGVMGYMSGYLETMNKPPIAISYYTARGADHKNAYYYLTRRPFEFEKGSVHNLISIGGPEIFLEDTTAYDKDAQYPDQHMRDIDAFVKKTYDQNPNKNIDYVFTWHGLMGYTRNGVRLAGPEPHNPVLLYNLGCNGIGILPSLFGATKIARHIRGDVVEPSLFDVPATFERATNIFRAFRRIFGMRH